MRKLLVCLPLLLAAAVSALAAEPASDRTVVIISLDGLAHFYFDDPEAEMPTLRALAAEGARAEKMIPVLPTVTWPNHTSLVTGVRPARHGVLGNSLFDREKAAAVPLIWDPLLDKDEIVKVPTIYDVAKQAGLTTAAVTWPGSRHAKSLDWTVPCVNQSALFLQYATPALLPELKAAGIPFENEALGFTAGHGEERDRNHVRIFNHILHTHRPRLALLHILEVDHVEHAHGPQSPEAYAAVKFADRCVHDVLEELKTDFPGRAALFVVSDHGFRRYRQLVQPNVVLRQAGLLTGDSPKALTGPVRIASQGGSTMLYILDPARREELTEQCARLFEKAEGIEKVIRPAEFNAYGFPLPGEDSHAPDLILSAADGCTFAESLTSNLPVTPKDEEKGSHGYDPLVPALQATFIAWGDGIRPGVKLPTVRNLDIAPTAAAMLGLTMPKAEGEVLQAILK